VAKGSVSRAVAEVAVPVHEEAGDGEDGEGEAGKRPEDFEGEAPEGAEVERVHGPEEPVAEGLVLAVVPEGEDAGVGGGEGEDIAVGEVSGGAKVDEGVDGGAGEEGIAEAEEVAVG
jgi:hypothetical protein